MLDDPFPIPIKIPENFGDKSTWLTWKPLQMAALIPTAIISKATMAATFSRGMNPKITKAIAGPIEPRINY